MMKRWLLLLWCTLSAQESVLLKTAIGGSFVTVNPMSPDFKGKKEDGFVRVSPVNMRDLTMTRDDKYASVFIKVPHSKNKLRMALLYKAKAESGEFEVTYYVNPDNGQLKHLKRGKHPRFFKIYRNNLRGTWGRIFYKTTPTSLKILKAHGPTSGANMVRVKGDDAKELKPLLKKNDHTLLKNEKFQRLLNGCVFIMVDAKNPFKSY